MPFTKYPGKYDRCGLCGTGAKDKCLDQRYGDNLDRRYLTRPHPGRSMLITVHVSRYPA